MSSKSVICTITQERTWTDADVSEHGISLVWLPNHTLVISFPKSKNFKHVKLPPPDSRQMTDLKMASAIRSSLLGKLSFDSVLKTKSLSYFVLHFGSLMA